MGSRCDRYSLQRKRRRGCVGRVGLGIVVAEVWERRRVVEAWERGGG